MTIEKGSKEPKMIKFQINRQLTVEEAAAFKIVSKLQNAGFESYIAGGAVRDLYLGNSLHDIDIATSAKPEEVKKIFPLSREQGKAFGVVVIKNGEFEFEVATFRNDIGIADHRRPKKVEFTTAENDAGRRDFTINALFYDPTKSQIIDYVGGRKDLENQIVRFVGVPGFRIDEDYLRMLRAIRFTHRFDFALDDESAKAIKENAHKIKEISAERIRDELTAIITGENREQALMQMESLNLLGALIPEVVLLRNVKQPPEFHSEGDVWIHTLLAMKSLEKPSAELAWTVLLHDVGKPSTVGYRDIPGKTKITFFEHEDTSVKMAGEILNKLKFSNEFIDASTWSISQHMRIIHAFRGMAERKQKKLFTHPHIGLLLDLTKADLGASLRSDHKADLSMYKDAVEKRKQFEAQAIDEEKNQVKKFTLITGEDIMQILKIEPGPKVGEVKAKIEEAYLNGKISTRQEALEMISASIEQDKQESK